MSLRGLNESILSHPVMMVMRICRIEGIELLCLISGEDTWVGRGVEGIQEGKDKS